MNTHLHLALKLRMSGTIPLLPLQTFMACMEHVYLLYLLHFTTRTLNEWNITCVLSLFQEHQSCSDKITICFVCCLTPRSGLVMRISTYYTVFLFCVFMCMIKSSTVNYFHRYQLCLILLCVLILVMVILLHPAVIPGEPLITYILIPWNRVLLQKLTSSQLVKIYPYFMEPKGSLSDSQMPATRPYKNHLLAA